MASPSRIIRKARHKVERAFRTAELALFHVDREQPAENPDAVLATLEATMSKLHPEDLAGRESLTRRLHELHGVPKDALARTRYRDRYGVDEVLLTVTSSGERIYRVVAQTFPGHENYVYVIITQDGAILWDVGSGELSRPDILRGMRVISSVYGQAVEPSTIKSIIISHAHIDHFGDVAFWREATGAPVSVHELDARVLTRFEERVVMAAKDMRIFFARAGLPPQECQDLETMYMASKELFRSVEVQSRLRNGDKVMGGHRVIHTPGHCPGHLCLRVGNALLVADQVLNPITPNLSPASLTAFNGLENYFNGLGRLRALEGIDHVLPAHAAPIPSLSARIDDILEHHQEKLLSVMDACKTPKTVQEVAAVLYGHQDGYNVLLALLEAGAHVEYLHQYGRLRVANLDTVVAERDPVIQYVAG